jgi:hypothetical protein
VKDVRALHALGDVLDAVGREGVREHFAQDDLLRLALRLLGALLRIRSVDVLDDSFAYPSRNEYDPEQVFRDSFGIFLDLPVHDVELRLHRQWAVYAQSHRWHDSQTVEVAGDHVRVRMRVRVCPELEAWILGFGEDAEVVAPAVLRAKIAKRAAGLSAICAGAGGPSVRKADQRRAEAPAKPGRKGR